jgi:hypothetical protein
MNTGSHVIFLPKGVTDIFSQKCRCCEIERIEGEFAYATFYVGTIGSYKGISTRFGVKLPLSMLVPFPFSVGNHVTFKQWYNTKEETGDITSVSKKGGIKIYSPERKPYPSVEVDYRQVRSTRKLKIAIFLESLEQ